MMYLIPKNIKVKKEIFKGFGLLELLVLFISFGVGFILQSFTTKFQLKVFLFSLFPLLTFILLLPLPNGSTPLIILNKFFKYIFSQQKYKFK